MKKKIDLKKGKTDWEKIKKLTERKIATAARSDQDAPILTRKELSQFKKVYSPKEINVQKIRKSLSLSQEQFARYFGVSKRTIQEWEQHRRTPTTTARNFLKVIEKAPNAVYRALAD